MGKHQKSWSQAEKLTIVKYYKEHGSAKASREFNVSSANIYNWVSHYEKGGSSSLSGVSSSDKDKEIYGAPQLLDRISVFLCLLDDA